MCGAQMSSFSSSTLCTYRMISRAESEKLCDSWRHVVHGLVYSPLSNLKLFGWISVKHAVMMQLRFDGRLGFPGGIVDNEDDSLEVTLRREFEEEMGNLPPHFKFEPEDYLSCTLLEQKKLCLHFFCKEVNFIDYLKIERRTDDEEFEVLGAVRVPMYMTRDCRGGLPAFLRNNFIGNAKEQLLHAIRSKDLMPASLIDDCILMSQLPDNMSSSSNPESNQVKSF